jgi:hypothetical protein
VELVALSSEARGVGLLGSLVGFGSLSGLTLGPLTPWARAEL